MIKKTVVNYDVSLYAEGFGHTDNPAILLIAGAGAPAAFWTDDFIEMLAVGGYFVIRFDHRDTGLSSAVDYENEPYSILDLADDALAILDGFGIKKAHVIGHSMGGTIAQILAISQLDRILSMHSMSVGTVGGSGAPSQEIMKVLLENKPTQNFDESLAGFMKSWCILNGDFSLNDCMAKEYTRDLYERSHHPVGVAWSHIKAQEGLSDVTEKLKTISVPAFFIHGEKDPLIPVAAGIKTAQTVPHGKITVFPKMGHMIFNKELEHLIVQLILTNLNTLKKQPQVHPTD